MEIQNALKAVEDKAIQITNDMQRDALKSAKEAGLTDEQIKAIQGV